MERLNLPSRQRGFTLVELLTVLAILAISATVAVPQIAGFANGMKLTAMTNDVVAHLRLARSESIMRRARVALCKSADGIRCSTQGGWEQGWIVFHDADNDGLRDPDEPVVQRMGALPQGWRVAGNANVARYISYHPSGGTKLVSGAIQVGTLTLCHISAGPTEAREVVLNIAGRPRINRTTVNNCS